MFLFFSLITPAFAGAPTAAPTVPPGRDLTGTYTSKIGTLSLAGGRAALWVSYEAAFPSGDSANLCSGVARLDFWGDGKYQSPDGAVALHVDGDRIVVDAAGGFCGMGWPGDAFALAGAKRSTCSFAVTSADRFALQDGQFRLDGHGPVNAYGALSGIRVEQEGPLVADSASPMGMSSGPPTGYWLLSESGWAFGVYKDGDVHCH